MDSRGAPSVFQCNNCRSNVSDSTELCGEVAELGAYVVNGLADATIDSMQQQTHLPDNTTRTYISVLCGGCGSAVGRCYESMEPHMQQLQHRFLLDVASVSRWQLGQCKQRAPAEATHGRKDASAASLEKHQQRIDELEEQLLKVQHMMCFQSLRLENLEAMSAAAEEKSSKQNDPLGETGLL